MKQWYLTFRNPLAFIYCGECFHQNSPLSQSAIAGNVPGIHAVLDRKEDIEQSGVYTALNRHCASSAQRFDFILRAVGVVHCVAVHNLSNQSPTPWPKDVGQDNRPLPRVRDKSS